MVILTKTCCELGTRIAELEKIRNFLTGQALTTVLDAIFSIIYIIVMVVYSGFSYFYCIRSGANTNSLNIVRCSNH